MNELANMMVRLRESKRVDTRIKRYTDDISLLRCDAFITEQWSEGISDEATVLANWRELSLNDKMSYLYLTKAGAKYRCSEYHAEIINMLSLYFMGMVEFPHDFSLDKGFALYGYWGVGKTAMFDNFKLCLNDLQTGNNYYVTSIEQIVDHYREHNSIKKFYHNWMGGEQYIPFHLVINEFGAEIKEKHYGTNVNEIINELMMLRYEVMCNKTNPKVTHITTNETQEALYKGLPMKLRDRFTEMFNFVELKGKSMRQ